MHAKSSSAMPSTRRRPGTSGKARALGLWVMLPQRPLLSVRSYCQCECVRGGGVEGCQTVRQVLCPQISGAWRAQPAVLPSSCAANLQQVQSDKDSRLGFKAFGSVQLC